MEDMNDAAPSPLPIATDRLILRAFGFECGLHRVAAHMDGRNGASARGV